MKQSKTSTPNPTEGETNAAQWFSFLSHISAAFATAAAESRRNLSSATPPPAWPSRATDLTFSAEVTKAMASKLLLQRRLFRLLQLSTPSSSIHAAPFLSVKASEFMSLYKENASSSCLSYLLETSALAVLILMNLKAP
ncbi:frataxin [Spatholobus suberectus]|nr:frataxin [Spatholobus suberectus]